MRLLIASVTLAAVASTSYQPPPDFSGTWVATKDVPADMPIGPTPTMGARFAVKQDATTVTLTRPFRETSMVVTYKLDGTPTRYRVPSRMCEGEAQYLETAVFEGAALAQTLVGTLAAGTGTERTQNIKRLMRKIDADTIVVQANASIQGKMTAVGTVYKRSNEAMAAPVVADVKGAPGTIAQLAWLPGFWVRTAPPPATAPANTPPLVTEERWTPAASGGMLALARTTRGATLSSFEFLCIAEKDGSLVYTAMPDGRTTPTFFTLTAITETSATFENPKHDYPQVVRYTLKPDGALETTISLTNGQRAMSVILQKQ